MYQAHWGLRRSPFAGRQTPLMRKLIASTPHNSGCVSGVIADMGRAILGELS